MPSRPAKTAARTTQVRWHIHEETRDGGAPGVWALARFLHRNQLPGEKEKNASAGSQLRLLVPKSRIPKGFMSSWQSILFLLACIRNPRCTKACQSPQPRPPSRPRAGFLHALRLSSLGVVSSVAQALQPVRRAAGPPMSGRTGFPACAPRGATPRLQGSSSWEVAWSCRRAVSARENRGPHNPAPVPRAFRPVRRGKTRSPRFSINETLTSHPLTPPSCPPRGCQSMRPPMSKNPKIFP